MRNKDIAQPQVVLDKSMTMLIKKMLNALMRTVSIKLEEDKSALENANLFSREYGK